MAEQSPGAVYEAYFMRTPLQLLSGMGMRRLVAFRVDEKGVLLGGAPARYASQTAFVPWAHITSVVVWHLRTAGPATPYIGVARTPGAPPLPGANSRLTPEEAAELAPHVEYDLFLASRPITSWRFDPRRLQAAVDAFHPATPVLAYTQRAG
ncbi:hypothetical protein [Streptomyces sp. NPDC050560]|uniref:hypothetical protein n=1 Tax=Streptomyces sp. NPDC050560 TaxID=3365630 RepID=UPI0037AAE839